MFNENNCMTLEKISANMPGALLVYKKNEGEEIIFVSREIVRIFECDSIEDFMKFTGGSFSTIVYPEDIEKIEDSIKSQVSATGGYDYIIYRIITKNGNIKTVEDWGHCVHDDQLGDLYYVYLHDMAMGEPFEDTAKIHELIDPVANATDDLTGLFSMNSFRKQAPKLIVNLLTSGETPHCVYFNIRNFRTYNEIYGLAGGDRMLKSFARILMDVFPDSLLSRFDKDHFVVIAPSKDLRERINRMSVRINNLRRGAAVEMKAGVYIINDANLDVSVICDCARFACESTKHEYGSVIQFYDGKLDQKAKLQKYIIEAFPKALENGELKVYSQNVIDIDTGKPASTEVFTRWEDATHGRLSPLEYIYVLEENHLIHRLDTFVIHEVAKEIKRRKDLGKEVVPVSINLSGLDFELTNVVQVIEDAVRENEISQDMLMFEITESLIAVDMDSMQREAHKLREHGFKVWMDAFGTGYSSLKVLKDFPLDGIKIDIDMIKLGDNTQRGAVIIAAMIDLAKKLGIPALAKGVETQEQLAFLKSVDCNLAQGYLFGKPKPIKD